MPLSFNLINLIFAGAYEGSVNVYYSVVNMKKMLLEGKF